MKKLLLLAGLALAGNSFAGELANYSQVKHAVMNGESIRIAVDFTKCSAANSKSVLPRYTLGVFSPNAIVINSDDTIKTAMKHFTLNDKNAPGKAVYQFVVYTMSPDNSVKLSIYVLDAVNYAAVAPKEAVVCSMAEGAKVYTR